MKLCGPAKFYALLSTVSLLLITLQNVGSKHFCLGVYSCSTNPLLVLIGHAIYILFWTWIITLICKMSTGVAWFIVLLPFILVFVLMGLLFTVIPPLKEERETTRPSIQSCIHCGHNANGFCNHCMNMNLI